MWKCAIDITSMPLLLRIPIYRLTFELRTRVPIPRSFKIFSNQMSASVCPKYVCFEGFMLLASLNNRSNDFYISWYHVTGVIHMLHVTIVTHAIVILCLWRFKHFERIHKSSFRQLIRVINRNHKIARSRRYIYPTPSLWCWVLWLWTFVCNALNEKRYTDLAQIVCPHGYV